MKVLSNYSLKADAEAFILRLEDEAGRGVEFILSASQLDDLIDMADDLLEDDDTALEPDDTEA